MSESNVVTPPDSFTIAILEAALAERDKEIKRLREDLEYIDKQAMFLGLHGVRQQCRKALEAGR